MSEKVDDTLETSGNRYKFGAQLGELPPYSPDYYRESIRAVRERLVRFDRFAKEEMKSLEVAASCEELDWTLERAGMERKLDRWLRQTEGVICDLAWLLREICDDKAVLEMFVREREGELPPN